MYLWPTLRRRANARDGLVRLLPLLDGRRPFAHRPPPGPAAIPLVPPALRIREGQTAHRHPDRLSGGASRRGRRRFFKRPRRALGGTARDVPGGGRALSSL